ncbi:hypothetical protein ACFQ07_31275, partial [Actinomadura adrarensis]
AFAGTVGGEERRTALFDRWHVSMTSTAEKLLSRAQEAGAVRTDLTVTDVLTLANAVARSDPDTDRVRRLLTILRHGLSGPTTPV